jgi:hypothetical protein
MSCLNCSLSLKTLRQMQENRTVFYTAEGRRKLWIADVDESSQKIRLKRSTGEITWPLDYRKLKKVHDRINQGRLRLDKDEIDKEVPTWGNYITGLLKYLGCFQNIKNIIPAYIKDPLFDDFCDPSKDFQNESRYFCYELASQLIKKAQDISGQDWHEEDSTIKGILLLLYTWNFAAKQTKKLDFENVRELLHNTKAELKSLENSCIRTVDKDSWNMIKTVFDKFRNLFGQTGASKALSLLNPKLFVMWDTAIRKRLNKALIPGIMKGENGEYYVIFLQGIQKIIDKYNITEKLPKDSIVAKKVDEYNYVKIVMNKKVKPLTKKKVFNPAPVGIDLPDNLRGRSIFNKIIPTVCNLKNMLLKLNELQGDVSLLKPWEKRSFDAYRIDKVKRMLLDSSQSEWKGLIRKHILQGDPSEFGASCIDIYLIAYVAHTFGAGKEKFFQYVKNKGISKKDNTAQAIWQVGKGDGVFLDILNDDGTIKDVEFIKNWIKR